MEGRSICAEATGVVQRCEKDGSGRSAANAKTPREDELQKRGPCDKGAGSAKESDVR